MHGEARDVWGEPRKQGGGARRTGLIYLVRGLGASAWYHADGTGGKSWYHA
jgi:hypothetical protein